MTDPVILKKPAARIDLAACYAYIGERNPDAARRSRVLSATTPACESSFSTISPHRECTRPVQVGATHCAA
jgi:toxin ParE1/3/4